MLSFDSLSATMRYALRLCRVYAQYERPLVFLGPIGSGKTTLAREAHAASGRSGKLVTVSAGELTETHYADRLFGHVAGAYTGAVGARAGAFAEAADGTLLLDDLALAPEPAQAAILRVIESGRFRPVGSSEDEISTARISFASTVSPHELVQRGDLLPDLHSRLGEFVVEVPPLRDREGEVLALAETLADRFLDEHDEETTVALTPEVRTLLTAYHWPFNIRELRSVVERAAVHAIAESDADEAVVSLRPPHLPERFHRLDELDAPSSRPKLTRALVEHVVREAGGNQSEAARRLGVHRNTVARYLKGDR